jgi:hypothetical protein
MTAVYQGKQFVMQSQWDPAQLTSNDVLRWWLYRESDLSPMPVQTMVVWLKSKQ